MLEEFIKCFEMKEEDVVFRVCEPISKLDVGIRDGILNCIYGYESSDVLEELEFEDEEGYEALCDELQISDDGSFVPLFQYVKSVRFDDLDFLQSELEELAELKELELNLDFIKEQLPKEELFEKLNQLLNEKSYSLAIISEHDGIFHIAFIKTQYVDVFNKSIKALFNETWAVEGLKIF